MAQTDKIQQFRREFESIVWQNSQLSTNRAHLAMLHRWDRNGSHEKAILKSLDKRTELKAKLEEMLNGHSYEQWKYTSGKLSNINTRLNRAKASKEKAEAERDSLELPSEELVT